MYMVEIEKLENMARSYNRTIESKDAEILKLKSVIADAKKAISMSRGQWIDSVNENRCLEVLAKIEEVGG